jgi:hypothetical protein
MLARFWGLALVAMCLPFLVNKRIYAGLLERMKSEEFLFLYSIIAVLIGALSVALQNSWTLDYKGLITLFGWCSLLKGFFGLLLPRPSIKFVDRFGKYWSPMFLFLALFFILGLWLLSVGL